jgi:hypothetical protein
MIDPLWVIFVDKPLYELVMAEFNSAVVHYMFLFIAFSTSNVSPSIHLVASQANAPPIHLTATQNVHPST